MQRVKSKKSSSKGQGEIEKVACDPGVSVEVFAFALAAAKSRAAHAFVEGSFVEDGVRAEVGIATAADIEDAVVRSQSIEDEVGYAVGDQGRELPLLNWSVDPFTTATP